ncbi:hypothetical protein DESC_70074 [Desulfosarcina cetonica]|nr:hypothetical protein DESC_70074 [Desulfosarcina cetonica]
MPATIILVNRLQMRLPCSIGLFFLLFQKAVPAGRRAEKVGLSAVLQFHAFPPGKMDAADRIPDHDVIDIGVGGPVLPGHLKRSLQPAGADPVGKVDQGNQNQQFHGNLSVVSAG